MKNLRIHAICVCIFLMSSSNSLLAQSTTSPAYQSDVNKPRLFDNLPDRVLVNMNNINSLFSQSVGSNIEMGLSENVQFQFDGELVSKVSKYNDKLQSLTIRSTNFNGAGFTISKITNDEGNIIYRGRIMSFKHGDIFELQVEGENYVLVKRRFYDLVNE